MKCDRCGKRYKEETGFVVIYKPNGDSRKMLDFCPKCMKELKTWIDKSETKSDPVQTMHEACKKILENEKEPECHNCKNILCGSFAEPCASCYKIGINWEPKK